MLVEFEGLKIGVEDFCSVDNVILIFQSGLLESFGEVLIVLFEQMVLGVVVEIENLEIVKDVVFDLIILSVDVEEEGEYLSLNYSFGEFVGEFISLNVF